MIGIIAGCYTPGNYAKVAQDHLILSLRKFMSLPRAIREIPDRGSWILNNSACQLYLQEIDREFPHNHLLYVDVDAYIHSDPWPLLSRVVNADPGKDVYAYWLDNKELLSGTLLLPSGPRRAQLLEAWVHRNNEFPKVWDQRNLQHIIEQQTNVPGGFRCGRLPPELCCIFDLQRRPGRTPDIHPVIEHFQASRTFKHGT